MNRRDEPVQVFASMPGSRHSPGAEQVPEQALTRPVGIEKDAAVGRPLWELFVLPGSKVRPSSICSRCCLETNRTLVLPCWASRLALAVSAPYLQTL